VYPSLHLSYEFEKGAEMQLNYSRRVNRPDGDDLNPKSESDDPRNLHAGNPALQPEYIHSVELGYKWQNKIWSVIPSLFYRYKYNGFTEIVRAINDSTLLTTQENLSTEQSAGLETILSSTPYKWLRANLTTTVFYNELDASNLGVSGKRSVFSMNTNLNSTITLKENTRLQLTYYYRSARLRAQGKTLPFSAVNAGIRQDFMKKKLAVTLTVSDIFKTWKIRTNLDNNQFLQTWEVTRNSRVVFLGASYRFGQSMKKQREGELMQFDREQ
jgi:outer membrane receptor protein involved in Fe transport